MYKTGFIVSVILNIILIAGLFYITHRLGGIRYLWFRVNNSIISGIYMDKVNLFENLPNEEKEIIFAGDSMTERGEWTEMFQNLKVKNRGIAGDVTYGLLKRLPEITASYPDRIFLMIGINDLLFGQKKAILINYQNIINQIKQQSPETKIYIQSLLPINGVIKRIPLDNEDIIAFNADLQKLIEKENLVYIDLYDLFTDEEGNLDAKYTVDGIHVNGDAYMIWKKAIEKYVNE